MADLAVPTTQTPQASSGGAIKLSDLVAGAQANAQKILQQYNSNPALQAAGISYIADPANPGRFIQIQGQTPLQQQQAELNVQKSAVDVGSANITKVQSIMKQMEDETGKVYSTEKSKQAVALADQGTDPADIISQIGAPDTYKQAEQLGFSMERAKSSRENAKKAWEDAGGASGVWAYIMHPGKAVAYNRTKTDTASALAKSLTGSSTGQQKLTQMLKDSIPDVGTPDFIAEPQWDRLMSQVQAQADDFGIQLGQQGQNAAGTQAPGSITQVPAKPSLDQIFGGP